MKVKAFKNLLEYAMLLKVKSAMKKSKRPDTEQEQEMDTDIDAFLSVENLIKNQV